MERAALRFVRLSAAVNARQANMISVKARKNANSETTMIIGKSCILAGGRLLIKIFTDERPGPERFYECIRR